MIFSKLQVSLAGLATVLIATGLGWEARRNVQLRTELARQTSATGGSVAALGRKIAAESQRVTEAEARVTALLKTVKVASAAQVSARAGASTTVDTADVAKAAIARAAQLLKAGRQSEALDEYIKCYRELQPIRPGSPECQSLMSAIAHLGRSYPAAITALAGLRDAAMAQRQAEPARRELPFEIALLNERLGEGSRTLALYDSLPAGDIGRQSLSMIANSSFVEARRYSDALIGRSFGQRLSMIESAPRILEGKDTALQNEIHKSIVDGTLTNIEVMTGAGKTDEARLLTEKLLAFDNTDTTRARLQQHLDRAQSPKP